MLNKVYTMKDLFELEACANMLVVETNRKEQRELVGKKVDKYQIVEIVERNIDVHDLDEYHIVHNSVPFRGIVYIKMVG